MMRACWKKIIVLFMSFTLILAFSACGSSGSQQENSGDSEQTVKTGTFSGVLQDALKDKLIVKSDEDIMEFKTVDATVYDLGQDGELTVGDTIDVAYKEEGSDRIADTVKITEHRVMDLYFEGTVNDMNTDDITVTGDGLTAHFLRDRGTSVKGNLSVGDQVKVTYTGDISEHPYAELIQVVSEEELPQYHDIKGTVADVSDNSLLISIDSSKAHRFKLTGKTKITGEANTLKPGYAVTVTYKGDIDQKPKATKVMVTDIPVLDLKVIDGTVKSVQESSFIIDTGKREYSFRTDEDTRYSGKKMKKGRIATVTYTGKLKKDPQALAVYCIKPKKKNKKEPVPDPKPEPKPQPKPQPKPVVDPTVTVYGEILNVDDNSASIQDEHGDAIDLTIDDNTTISSGYLPAVGDHVQVTYNKDTMVMIDLQLLFRPDTSKKSTDEQVDKQADNAGDKALANDDTQTSTNDETE